MSKESVLETVLNDEKLRDWMHWMMTISDTGVKGFGLMNIESANINDKNKISLHFAHSSEYNEVIFFSLNSESMGTKYFFFLLPQILFILYHGSLTILVMTIFPFIRK
jgi:AAA15 family ATPase/GTPase